MRINDFNYFDKSTEAKKGINTQLDFDLDLQQTSTIPAGSNQNVQGSGHWWCHPTDHCTGEVCVTILTVIVCN